MTETSCTSLMTPHTVAFSNLYHETKATMICCYCSSEIPQGQPICPSCYASVSPDKREVPERPGTDILVFISDTVQKDFHFNRKRGQQGGLTGIFQDCTHRETGSEE